MSPGPHAIPDTCREAVEKGESAGILVLSPRLEDRARFQQIFQKRGPKIYEAVSWREGVARLERHRPQIVLCEALLPDADWREVLGHTAVLADAPRLIVIASGADECLWADVLNLGGYDVLSTPLVEEEVVRVVGLAWQNWKNERERRAGAG